MANSITVITPGAGGRPNINSLNTGIAPKKKKKSLALGYFAPKEIKIPYIGYSLEFDLNERILIQTDGDITGNSGRSMSIWVKLLSGNDSRVYVQGTSTSTGRFFALAMHKDNNEIGIHTDLVDSNYILTAGGFNPDSNWHHYVATYCNGTMKLYVDSVLSATKNNMYIDTVNNNFSIGSFGDSLTYGYQFIGEIDAFEVFNYELTQSDINILYNNGFGVSLNLPNTAIVLSLNFDQEILYRKGQQASIIGNPEFILNDIATGYINFNHSHPICPGSSSSNSSNNSSSSSATSSSSSASSSSSP